MQSKRNIPGSFAAVNGPVVGQPRYLGREAGDAQRSEVDEATQRPTSPPTGPADVDLTARASAGPGAAEIEAPSVTATDAPPSDQGAQVGSATGEAILAAARSLALDVGFRRATIVDVARRAGVSRMTVYREFEDLGSIWSDLLTQELVAMMDDAAGDLVGVNARERLVRAAEALVTGISHHPLFRRALDVDPELLLPLVVDRFGSSQQAALEHIEALLSVGVLDGSIDVDRATASAACAVLLTVQSFIFSARVLEARDDSKVVLGELGVLLDRYLAP